MCCISNMYSVLKNSPWSASMKMRGDEGVTDCCVCILLTSLTTIFASIFYVDWPCLHFSFNIEEKQQNFSTTLNKVQLQISLFVLRRDCHAQLPTLSTPPTPYLIKKYLLTALTGGTRRFHALCISICVAFLSSMIHAQFLLFSCVFLYYFFTVFTVSLKNWFAIHFVMSFITF